MLRHLKAGHPEAIMYVRAASRIIGEVVSDVVSILNPRIIVIGGTLAVAGELLASGIRELIYQRCLPLATQDLKIELAEPDEDLPLVGAGYLLFERLFSTDGVLSVLQLVAEARAASERYAGSAKEAD